MNESNIMTVTLNPSLDETITVSHLNLGYHNLAADAIRLDASGRGVNVSHALYQLGIHAPALVLLGGDAMGHAYKGLLAEQAFKSTIVRHQGHTRSDTIIYDQGEDKETHIIDEGTGATQADIEQVIVQLQSQVKSDDTVVLAGKLPTGLSETTYERVINVIAQIGAKAIVMVGHESLDTILKSEVELIALTRLEMESYFNFPVRTFTDMVACAEKLIDKGTNQVIVTHENFEGAILVTPNQKLMVQLDTDNRGTDSGVSDSIVAGYLVGIHQGKNPAEAFRLGATAMKYASSQLGNKFGTLAELYAMRNQIDVVAYDPSLKI